MKEFYKIILLAYIGEMVVNKINKEDEKYVKVREAMDFCWHWIENQKAELERIYEFLDSEEEEDLVYYVITAEEEKKEYEVILGVVSYIALNIITSNKEPVPQFLSETDEEYYNSIIADAIQLNIMDSDGKHINKIVKYCRDKEKENDFRFVKSQIMSL